MSIIFVIYASILFLIAELSLLIVKRADTQLTKTPKDRKSLLVFWLIIPLSITAGFMTAKYDVWDNTNQLLFLVGMLVFSIGFVFRWLAIYQLRKEFTVDVSIVKNHNLYTNGLYAVIRHPSYLGLLLMVSGLAIGMNSLVAFVLVVFPIFFAVRYRIYVEELVLIEAFKDSYSEYILKTKRLIPWVY